jgi:hypothetical protein
MLSLMEIWLNRRTHMRKIGLLAVAAALTLAGVGAGVGAWAASSTHRPGEIAAGDRIDPFQIMLNAKDLPTSEYHDLSLVQYH